MHGVLFIELMCADPGLRTGSSLSGVFVCVCVFWESTQGKRASRCCHRKPAAGSVETTRFSLLLCD